MNNNERQAGTNAQQSTNAELTTSSPLAANPMLADVASAYDVILEMYKSSDDLRVQFTKPFFINDLAISTDASSMVFFDKKLCKELEYFTGKDPNNIISIIPTLRNESFNFSLEILNNALAKCPLIDEILIEETEEECEECDGEGCVEYEYKSKLKSFYTEMDCPICDGQGIFTTETKTPTGNKVLDLDKSIQIKQSSFAAKQLSKLAKVAELLNENTITLVYQIAAQQGSIFKIGQVEILVMPTMLFDNIEDVVCHIS